MLRILRYMERFYKRKRRPFAGPQREAPGPYGVRRPPLAFRNGGGNGKFNQDRILMAPLNSVVS